MAQTVQADQPRGAVSHTMSRAYDDGRASPYSAASSDPYDEDPPATEFDQPAASVALIRNSTDDARADQGLDHLSEAAAPDDAHGCMPNGEANGVNDLQPGALNPVVALSKMLPYPRLKHADAESGCQSHPARRLSRAECPVTTVAAL